MLRSIVLAGSIALSALVMSPAAEARTDFNVYLGVPFYGQRVEPGWRYYPGHGWYDYNRYGDFERRNRGNLTCNQARRLVDRAGYDNVRPVQCFGRVYVFKAETRRGHRVNVRVNSRTGAIW